MPVVGSVARVGESAFHPDCLVCSSCHLAFTWHLEKHRKALDLFLFGFDWDHVNHVSEMTMIMIAVGRGGACCTLAQQSSNGNMHKEPLEVKICSCNRLAHPTCPVV